MLIIQNNINQEHVKHEIDLDDHTDVSESWANSPQSLVPQKNEVQPSNIEPLPQNIFQDIDNRPTIKKYKTLPANYKESLRNKNIIESTLRLRNKNIPEPSTAENVKIKDKEPNIREPSTAENVEIKNKEPTNFFVKSIHWSWIVLILLVCVVLIYMMFRLETIHVEDSKVHIKMAPKQRPFIEDFANSTTKLIEDIIQVNLPSSDSVMDGTVSCRRFANIVEDSPAFKETGSSIAKLLREFSDKIMVAGIALEDMYRKGDMLFWVLNKEISEMMSKLNPSLFNRFFENEDEAFFKGRIQELINVIEEFRSKVTSARKAIVDAEYYRDPAEKYVRKGIIEATKFIHNGPKIHEYRLKLNEEEKRLENVDGDKAIDVLNAVDELKHADNTLKILENSHEALDLINKILLSYRSKLFDVEAQLSKTKKSKVTERDLAKLEKLVDTLKSSQQKFIGKDTLGDKARIYV